MTNLLTLKCPCGHETAENEPHSHRLGHIVRDQDMVTCFETPAAEVADFLRAIQEGRRQVWVEEFYGKVGFDLQDGNIIQDILTRRHAQTLLTIFQCEECGRISIERSPSTFSFRSFEPESRDWRGALASRPFVDPIWAGQVTFAEDKPWWKFW